MEIPGFDLYSFPSQPEVLYAIRDFDFRVGEDDFELIVELLITQSGQRAVVKQGAAKAPKFLIRNSAEGFLKPIGAGVSREIRKVLFSYPAGDVLEGCGDAVAEAGSFFGVLPLPGADVVARIPVVVTHYVEFENKLGSRRNVKRAVFELKPQNFGFVVATEHGLEAMAEEIQKRIKALSP